MKIIGFKETPAQLLGEHLPDCRFASAGDTENDDHHVASLSRWLLIFSKKNAATTLAISCRGVCAKRLPLIFGA